MKNNYIIETCSTGESTSRESLIITIYKLLIIVLSYLISGLWGWLFYVILQIAI